MKSKHLQSSNLNNYKTSEQYITLTDHDQQTGGKNFKTA